MIVVDTNVIAYLWLPGDRAEKAEQLLEDGPEWSASLLWRSELRNVLADLTTILQIMSEAEGPMQGRELG